MYVTDKHLLISALPVFAVNAESVWGMVTETKLIFDHFKLTFGNPSSDFSPSPDPSRVNFPNWFHRGSRICCDVCVLYHWGVEGMEGLSGWEAFDPSGGAAVMCLDRLLLSPVGVGPQGAAFSVWTEGWLVFYQSTRREGG